VRGTYLHRWNEIMPCWMVVSSNLCEGTVLTAYHRNGWGPGGSNPKVA